MFKRSYATILATLLVTLILSGCTVSPGDPPLIQRLMPLFRLATTLGTDRVLTKNPTYTAPVVAVTNGLLTLFNTNTAVTMAQLHASVRATLSSMNLAPDVRMVIEALLESVVNELRAVIISHGVSDDQVTLYLHEVVSWMRDAALLHMPVRGQ